MRNLAAGLHQISHKSENWQWHYNLPTWRHCRIFFTLPYSFFQVQLVVQISCQGMIHIWRPWKFSSFQDPPPPCPSTSKILQLLWPWTLNFKRTLPHLYPNDNQSIKRKHNSRMTIYVIKSFLQVGFRFQYL